MNQIAKSIDLSDAALEDTLPMSFTRACEAFGNGDTAKGRNRIFEIAKRIEWARMSHPVFGEGVYQGLSRITDEHEELVHAVEHESEQRQFDEALDVIATSVRFANKEYEFGD